MEVIQPTINQPAENPSKADYKELGSNILFVGGGALATYFGVEYLTGYGMTQIAATDPNYKNIQYGIGATKLLLGVIGFYGSDKWAKKTWLKKLTLGVSVGLFTSGATDIVTAYTAA